MNWPLRAAESETESEESNSSNRPAKKKKKRPAIAERNEEEVPPYVDRRTRRKFSDTERLERRRASNRQSAARARERTKTTIEALQARISLLEARNRELAMTLETVLLENQQMRDIIGPTGNQELAMLNRGRSSLGGLQGGMSLASSGIGGIGGIAGGRADHLMMKTQGLLSACDSLEQNLLTGSRNNSVDRAFLRTNMDDSAGHRNGAQRSTSALAAAAARERTSSPSNSSSSDNNASNEYQKFKSSLPSPPRKEPKNIPTSLELALKENERARAQRRATAIRTTDLQRNEDGSHSYVRDTLTALAHMNNATAEHDGEEEIGMGMFSRQELSQSSSSSLRENRLADLARAATMPHSSAGTSSERQDL